MIYYNDSGNSKKSQLQHRLYQLTNKNVNVILKHSRDHSGRYIVRLPFKQSRKNLGDSRFRALRIINSLSKRFTNEPEYATAYYAFLREYELLGHMIRVPDSQPEPEVAYYLPHHGVFRENSSTTKLRVVFNGSSRTTTGISLNDLLHTGAKLQTDGL